MAKRAMALDGVPAFEPQAEQLQWPGLPVTKPCACSRFDPKDSTLLMCHCGRHRLAHDSAALQAWADALTQQLGRIP